MLRRRVPSGLAVQMAAWIGLGVWAWVRIIDAPFSVLVRNLLADDAFYYFDLARNFPRPEVTRGIVTTGFHPLYWVLIAPFFKLLGPTAAVRASLLLLLAANAGAAYVLYLVARRRFPDLLAGVVAAGWIVASHVRGLVTLGLEMPLAVLAVALVMLMCDRRPATRRQWLLTGALVGLAFLARTDSIVITGAMVAWCYLRSGPRRVQDAIATAAAALVVASPWLCFLFLRSAVGAQDSVVSHRLASGRSGLPFSFVGPVFRYLGRNVALGFLPSDIGGRWPLVVIILGIGTALAAARYPAARQWLRDRAGLAAGVVVIFVLYALVLHFVDLWYVLYGLFAVWTLTVPLLLELIAGACRRVGTPALVAAGALGLGLMASWLRIDDGAFAQNQLDAYRAARVAAVRVPSNARLASFNSGLIQFVMRQPVVNLDGVVNPKADKALRRGTMCSYLHKEAIGYFIDTDNGFDRLHAVARQVVLGPISVLDDRQGPIPHVRLAAVDTPRC